MEVPVTLRDGSPALRRPLRPEDAAALVAMDRALAEDGRGMVLTPDQVRSEREQRAAIEATRAERERGSASLGLAVVTIRGAILGAGHLSQLRPRFCSHVGVLALGVDVRHQGRGVGRLLLEGLVDAAWAGGLERLELYVRADNTRARALYADLGFVDEGRRARFVRLPDGRYVDDRIMALFRPEGRDGAGGGGRRR